MYTMCQRVYLHDRGGEQRWFNIPLSRTGLCFSHSLELMDSFDAIKIVHLSRAKIRRELSRIPVNDSEMEKNVI